MSACFTRIPHCALNVDCGHNRRGPIMSLSNFLPYFPLFISFHQGTNEAVKGRLRSFLTLAKARTGGSVDWFWGPLAHRETTLIAS